MAEWHALAKMRLHSDDTIILLDRSLRRLGSQLRKFSSFTCSAFRTFELPGETAARHRKQHSGFESQPSVKATGPRPKSFNLFTYKLHALGDYVQSIRRFGTTDSYTTQIVSASALFKNIDHSLTLDAGRVGAPSYQEVLPNDQQKGCIRAISKTRKASDTLEAAAESCNGGTSRAIAGASSLPVGFLGQLC
jgi:hypothetical protein